MLGPFLSFLLTGDLVGVLGQICDPDVTKNGLKNLNAGLEAAIANKLTDRSLTTETRAVTGF